MGLQLLNLQKSFPHSVPCPKITRMTEILQTIVFSHLSTGILIHMGFFLAGKSMWFADQSEQDNLCSY